MSARVITIMNFKGGVGKTTVAMNLGHCLEFREKYRKVLLVDADPQFNLSQYLLGYERYMQIIDNNTPTLYELLEEGSHGVPIRPVTDYIVNVDTYASGKVDLICSKLELYQSLQASTNSCVQFKNKISPLLDDYDVVLIDCPPTISIISEAAFYISDFILIPIMPEYLCTIGLPLLYQSVMSFKKKYLNNNLNILGAVINGEDGYSPEGYNAILDIQTTCKDYGIPLFHSSILYSRSYPKGARMAEPIFQTPYSRSTTIQNFYSFVSEFTKLAGV